MAFYVAVKLPVVFVGSTLIVSAFAWAAGLAVGSGLRYRNVLSLDLRICCLGRKSSNDGRQ